MNILRKRGASFLNQLQCHLRINVCNRNLARKYSNKCDLNLQLNDVSLNNYVNQLNDVYKNICEGKSISDNSKYNLITTVGKILERRGSIVENIKNLQDLIDDKDNEISKLAQEEKEQFESEIKQIDEQLIDTLLPQDELEYDSIILEVNCGVGGQEAMLFAKEMFDMYSNFINYKGN